MKNFNSFLVPLFSLILITIFCNKAAEFNHETTLLTQHTRKLESTSLNGEIRFVDIYQEDSYTFKANHAFSFISNSAYSYQFGGDWEIKQDKLLLRNHYNENDPSEYSDTELIIYELTNSILTLGHRFEQNGQMNSFRNNFKPN